jgi:hypothetical protein
MPSLMVSRPNERGLWDFVIMQNDSGYNHEQCVRHRSIHLSRLAITVYDSFDGRSQRNFRASTSYCDSSSACSTSFPVTLPEAQYYIQLSATDVFGRATPVFSYPNRIRKYSW